MREGSDGAVAGTHLFGRRPLSLSAVHIMDFIRSRLSPLTPLDARKYHCPSTALNLDREIAGVFWLYFCCRTIAQLFPGGLHIEVHVYIETDNAADDGHEHEPNEPDDRPDDDEAGDEFLDLDEENGAVIALMDGGAVEDLT